MDSFITLIEQKNNEVNTTLHSKEIELVRKYIKERQNVFICGPTGVGKTYVLNEALKGMNCVELEYHHLKSKSLFLPFIKPTTKHVFIEDYDQMFKSIVADVSDGNRISRGCLLVTSKNMCFFPNFKTVMISKHTPETILTLVEDRDSKTLNAAYRCKGNIRNFYTYRDGYEEMNEFKTSKEYISDILTDDNRELQFHKHVSEHGHMWDVFQENYLDSKDCDITTISESFSMADVYDTLMYSMGAWNLMPFFTLHSLTIPKYSLGTPLESEKIRPGSCWTKYGNYKMRKRKYDEIKKKSRMGLGVEELCLLKDYAHKGDLSKLVDYKITPQDFDVINHLAIGNSLKSKDVTKIKKALKNVYEGRRT